MGSKMGPGLAVFQLPVSALVNPGTSWLERNILRGIAQGTHGMLPTIAQLDTVQVLSQRWLEHQSGLQMRWINEGLAQAKSQGISPEKTAEFVGNYVKGKNNETSHTIAFWSLPLKPSGQLPGDFHTAEGAQHSQNKDYAKAEESYRKGIAVDPHNENAKKGLAQVLQRQAGELLRPPVEKGTKPGPIRVESAAKAVALSREATALDPNNGAYHASHAEALIR